MERRSVGERTTTNSSAGWSLVTVYSIDSDLLFCATLGLQHTAVYIRTSVYSNVCDDCVSSI